MHVDVDTPAGHRGLRPAEIGLLVPGDLLAGPLVGSLELFRAYQATPLQPHYYDRLRTGSSR